MDAETTATPLVELRGLSFAYPESNGPVLDAVELCLEEGSRIGLFGPNGCGKTTLVSILMGLFPPTGGEVRFRGRPLRGNGEFRALRREVGFVFQQADDQILFPTVLDDVAFGPLNLGLDPEAAGRVARETLDFLGLSGFEDRLTHKLSGGEKKLVTLAGVLAMKPRALILDEPTAGLDPATRDRLVAILRGLDVATLIISHDWDFLHDTSTTYFTIESGKLVATPESWLHEHIHSHPLGTVHHHHHKNGRS